MVRRHDNNASDGRSEAAARCGGWNSFRFDSTTTAATSPKCRGPKCQPRRPSVVEHRSGMPAEPRGAGLLPAELRAAFVDHPRPTTSMTTATPPRKAALALALSLAPDSFGPALRLRAPPREWRCRLVMNMTSARCSPKVTCPECERRRLPDPRPWLVRVCRYPKSAEVL